MSELKYKVTCWFNNRTTQVDFESIDEARLEAITCIVKGAHKVQIDHF